jgi:hypothetical protein
VRWSTVGRDSCVAGGVLAGHTHINIENSALECMYTGAGGELEGDPAPTAANC